MMICFIIFFGTTTKNTFRDILGQIVKVVKVRSIKSPSNRLLRVVFAIIPVEDRRTLIGLS